MNLDSLSSPKEILSEIKKRGFFVYKDNFTVNLSDSVRREYSQKINCSNVLPTDSPIHEDALSKLPVRQIESRETSESSCNFMTTYFDENDDGNISINQMFNLLITMRHELSKSWPTKSDNYWNACRIHHYPSGGGFFGMHKDTHTAAINLENDFPYLQVSLLLSMKNRDFEVGGFRLIGRAGESFIEQESHYGAILIFDGLCDHGIDYIDPQSEINYSSDRGRISALSNFYNKSL